MIGRAATRARRGAILVSLLAVCGLAGCAPSLSLMNLPSGPGETGDFGVVSAAFQQATKGCQAVSTFVAQASLRGAIGTQRVRGNLDLGIAPPSVRLDLVAPVGQPFFYFVAQAKTATLLLTRENRVATSDDPVALLEALTGIPFGNTNRILPTLLGCGIVGADALNATRFSDDWLMLHASEFRYYLNRASRNEPWRVVALSQTTPNGRTWRAEYRDFRNDLPQRVLFYAVDQFQLELALSQVELNRPLGPDAFQVKVPPSAVPMTLEELRKSGPLSGSSNDEFD